MIPLLTMQVRYEQDVVLSRQRARQISGLLGFDAQDQTRIATAVSEIARNAYEYAGGGRVLFGLKSRTSEVLCIRVEDQGPGIGDLRAILGGRYVSKTGMGLGIVGAKRLMDGFTVDSSPGGGTTVLLEKTLPRRRLGYPPLALDRIAEELARSAPRTAFDEVQLQNQELMHALGEVKAREAELAELNRELNDTNRGVVALYAELDEKAAELQRASELKSRFLSNMSHEFRTPVNSIVNLARFLLERVDGELTPEQEKQVRFILSSAESLSELVNDLLDLAKIEAGKVTVRPQEFGVPDLFGALRGMFRPLLGQDAVALRFDEGEPIPTLFTDEGKVSQILRNFVSNALKFTERGEVVVSAAQGPDDTVVFSVADTGIGIAPEDLARIFEEFNQIEGDVQKRHKGTGLGLPLSQKLAELLGGKVAVTSALGVGSTFSVTLPRRYPTNEATGETDAGELMFRSDRQDGGVHGA